MWAVPSGYDLNKTCSQAAFSKKSKLGWSGDGSILRASHCRSVISWIIWSVPLPAQVPARARAQISCQHLYSWVEIREDTLGIAPRWLLVESKAGFHCWCRLGSCLGLCQNTWHHFIACWWAKICSVFKILVSQNTSKPKYSQALESGIVAQFKQKVKNGLKKYI